MGGPPPTHAQAEPLSNLGVANTGETRVVAPTAEPLPFTRAQQKRNVAGQTAIKIRARRTDKQCVSYWQLIAAGFTSSTNPCNLLILLDGLELPIRQGWRVAVMEVEDVYDELRMGEKTPDAIRELLLYATTNWIVKPRFLLLAGDASYAPRDHRGLGETELVPTRLSDTA